MPLQLNDLLKSEGLDPKNVRLMRHQTGGGKETPYSVWRDDLPRFERYQSFQLGGDRRAYFNAPYWASFVVPPAGNTLFVGVYSARLIGHAQVGERDPIFGHEMPPHIEIYETARLTQLAAYVGRLSIKWGKSPSAARAWVQRADKQDKEIVEVTRAFQEEAFPGFTKFTRPLSALETMPTGWRAILQANQGVYLLACPRTREHYVGSAYGEGGFLGRWRAYVADGHGGNVGLRLRDPSDFVVSILEAVGSSSSPADVVALEQTWKAKLLSRDIGLNHN